ncbi:MAG: trk/ktr system potassium uptake protein [Oceanotoga sp.]|uniref:potassium channel family protein n=1 Tax=Oceanotoga sp. TaxID=2108366 RepID=UPI0026533F3A|nr:TrkA family potassium uptake protein [Oceanotoga sp.]MDN5343027.1 trk/ktr system potassium uptake protein [Oceanotoga sp.]
MYIIVIGCGRTGSKLANYFSSKNHNVVVIDNDESTFQKLEASFNGITILGNGIDEEILLKAGIEKADAVLTMTKNDNTNIMAGQIAKKIYQIKKVIAKINNKSREELYKNLGLEIINTTEINAIQITNMLFDEKIKFFPLSEEFNIINIKAKKNLNIENFYGMIPSAYQFLFLIREENILYLKDIKEVINDDNLIFLTKESNLNISFDFKEVF